MSQSMASEGILRFNGEELLELTNNWATLVGKGAQGHVFKGWLSAQQRVVAVKLLACKDEHQNRKVLRKELAASRQRHTNLVELVGYCSDPPAFVYEYVAGGDLGQVLKHRRKRARLSMLKRLKDLSTTRFSMD